jgi:hypothetical protein
MTDITTCSRPLRVPSGAVGMEPGRLVEVLVAGRAKVAIGARVTIGGAKPMQSPGAGSAGEVVATPGTDLPVGAEAPVIEAAQVSAGGAA